MTEFHAGKNKRNDLKKIDHENARIFGQLSKQACSVYPVDKLKAEYEKAKALKTRISKSKRTPAGIPLPTRLDVPVLVQKKEGNLYKSIGINSDTMNFQ